MCMADNQPGRDSWRSFHGLTNDHPLDPYHITYDGGDQRWEHCRVCDHVAAEVNVLDITVTSDGQIIRRVVA